MNFDRKASYFKNAENKYRGNISFRNYPFDAFFLKKGCIQVRKNALENERLIKLVSII